MAAGKRFQCGACQFVYFHNVAAAVAAVITARDDLLLAVRKHDPQAGMLDLPGGFVDPGESAEEALRRELLEELGIVIADLHYMCSFPNLYVYENVPYRTIDFFYAARLGKKPELRIGDDIAGYVWVPTNAVPYDKIAFESISSGIRCGLKPR